MIFHMVFCRGEMAGKISYLILATFFRHPNIDISYLVLSTYRIWFCRQIRLGRVPPGKVWGLGSLGACWLGCLDLGGGGGYVVWVSWVVAINTIAYQ